MEEKSIRKYAHLMQELGLTGLEVGQNGDTLRLEMSNNNTTTTTSVDASTQMIVLAQESDSIPICSPMVGVFYSGPAENAAPYIQVGDSVKKGDILCVIGAMKLMNEIPCEQDGVITEVCVGNNQVVDYGHVLFRMRKGLV